MKFERYQLRTYFGDTDMYVSSDGDYVPYQQAQAVLEQLNSVNTALEKHFGPASIAEVSQYVELYRKRIKNLEADLAQALSLVVPDNA